MARPEKYNPAPRWGYVFYQEDKDEEAPAFTWLAGLPASVRDRFIATLDAVLLTKHPPRAYLPNRWHSMKEVQGRDMGDYFEARHQYDGTNYRLFCRFDSAAATTALGSPVLVIIDGASKPVRRAMPDSAYARVQQLWARYLHPERRCSEVDFPPIELDSE